MKIGIVGMGGVGSFLGAKLTQHFAPDEHTKVIFICRGETKDHIVKNGLSFSSAGTLFHAIPDLTTDQPEEIGILDILIIATKSFSLAEAVRQYQPCFDKNTVIIPLQNMVNAKEILCEVIDDPKPNILEGCIYVASNRERPGFVTHVGGPGKVFFGNEDASDFQWVEEILRKGGVDAIYTKNIKHTVWKKYLFVSPLATLTTALNITFGEIAEDTYLMAQLTKLMKEVQQVANQLNVGLTEKDIQDALGMLSHFPYQAKSSLQLDVENHEDNNEKYYLVDYLIESGDKWGVEVNTYKEMNEKLAAHSRGNST